MTKLIPHQFIERLTGSIRTEALYYDRIVNFIYQDMREKVPQFFKLLTCNRFTGLLGFCGYDLALGAKGKGLERMINSLGIDLSECLEGPSCLNTPRKIFERKIRYWETRPISGNPAAVLSPADAKVLVGSFAETSTLFLKEKYFDFEELIGAGKTKWLQIFDNGSYAIFRLTPEKYHYNHTPVSGEVLDIYEISGDCHSCNPGAVVTVVSPYSKNKRVVTIINTDVDKGTQAGLVAMIEIAALMIGDIVQCYSDHRYESPQTLVPGMFLKKGKPKSLFRPGSSVDVLIFQKGRVEFSQDIIANMYNFKAHSRFSQGLGRPLVETEIAVRSEIALRRLHNG